MIKLTNIKKTYGRKGAVETVALNDINLEFNHQGLVFITGKSGCGKTTLLNILGGLDQDFSGELRILDKSTNDFKICDYDTYRNTMVGFIFQEYNLLDDLTVFDNIGFALELQGLKKDALVIEDVLNEVGLSGYQNKYPKELSVGENQRVSIARALVKKPKLILADEPSAFLDSETSNQIFLLLKELSKTHLVIVVSHDIDYASLYGDRIISMKDGSIIKDEVKSTTVISNQIDDEAYLPVKSHMPFLVSVRLGLKALAKKPLKVFLSIILTSFALMLLAFSDHLRTYDEVEALTYVTKETGDPYFGLFMYVSVDGKEKEHFMYDTSYDYLSNEFKEINFYKTYRYMDDYYSLLEHYSGNDYSLDFDDDFYHTHDLKGYMYLTDDLKSDYDFSLVHGKYPTESNEVAISLYTASNFKTYGYREDRSKPSIQINDYETLIGKSFYNKKIVGIIDTKLDSNYESLKVTKDLGLRFKLRQALDIRPHNVAFIHEDASPLKIISTAGYEFGLKMTEDSIISFNSFINIEDIENITYYLNDDKTKSTMNDDEYIIHKDDFMMLFSASLGMRHELRKALFLDKYLSYFEIADATGFVNFDEARNTTWYQTNYNETDSDLEVYQNLALYALNNDDAVNFYGDYFRIYEEYVRLIEKTKEILTYEEMINEKPILDMYYPRYLGYQIEKDPNINYLDYMLTVHNPSLVYIHYFDQLDETTILKEPDFLEMTKIIQMNVLSLALDSEYLELVFRLRNSDYVAIDEMKFVGFYEDDDYLSRTSYIIGHVDPLRTAVPTLFINEYRQLFGVFNDCYDDLEALSTMHYDSFDGGYRIFNHQTDQLLNASQVFSDLGHIGEIVSIILLVFSSLLLYHLIVYSIKDKIKEIGIIRSLGGRRKDILEMFLTENLIVAILNGFVTSVMYVIVHLYFNSVLSHDFNISVPIIYISIRAFILIFLVSITLSLLTTVIPVLLITKKEPINQVEDR